MLVRELSNESNNRIKVIPVHCQVKSKALADATKIFERILEVLNAKNAPEVARKLGLAKQSVYEWRENTPSIDNLIKIAELGNASLDWLLTGKGEKRSAQNIRISFDKILEEKMTEIARREIEIARSLVELREVEYEPRDRPTTEPIKLDDVGRIDEDKPKKKAS